MDVFTSNNFKGKKKSLYYQSIGVKFICILQPIVSLQEKFENVLHYIRMFGINNSCMLIMCSFITKCTGLIKILIKRTLSGF